MNWTGFLRQLLVVTCIAAALSTPPVLTPTPANAASNTPFKGMAGRWSGEGRIGIKDGKPEKIRCRVTYFLSNKNQDIRQNLRCNTQNYKVEVKTDLHHLSGKLTGTWRETIHNLSGRISGKTSKNNLTLFVRGDTLTATMQIITKGNRQIVEIKFENIELIGLTIILKKG